MVLNHEMSSIHNDKDLNVTLKETYFWGMKTINMQELYHLAVLAESKTLPY